MINLQGPLLKAITVAWDVFSDRMKSDRRRFAELDAILIVPNTLESFRVMVEEDPTVWRIIFFPNEVTTLAYNRAYDRKHPETLTAPKSTGYRSEHSPLSAYNFRAVVRKSDFKVLERNL